MIRDLDVTLDLELAPEETTWPTPRVVRVGWAVWCSIWVVGARPCVADSDWEF